MLNEEVIRIENIKKKYRLGVIGSGTLQGDIQSFFARLRKKEDPNKKIGMSIQKGEFWALEDINLSICKGETLGIIGGNGAGKSTLLKILSRVTAPTEGNIYVKGKIASMLEVGTGFHRELTGRENIYLNGAIMGMSEHEIDERMDKIIDFSEIREFIDTPVKRYSSGMYVKLAFSVAAHLNADILIMDEVLAVGDARFQQKCVEKMKQLASEEGKTVLLVSHNMDTISKMCDRCLVLEKGKMKYLGDVGKAIELYVQQYSSSHAVFYPLDKKERPKNISFDFEMLSFEFLNKKVCEFEANEKMICKLCFKSNKKIEDGCIRIVLQHNGISIGTILSEKIDTIEENKINEIIFEMDTSALAIGTYTSSIGIYRHTDEGFHTPLDYIETAFSFQIIKSKIENKVWRHRFWGSVIFNDAEIISHTSQEMMK